jgi:hypothetical protein
LDTAVSPRVICAASLDPVERVKTCGTPFTFAR